MKRIPILILLAMVIGKTALCQTVKSFNTMTFFYIDNSEGYTSDELNASLNFTVTEEFKKRLNAVNSKPDNYFFMLASNGSDIKQSTNANSILDSDWLKKYLSRTSKEADYVIERQSVRDNFSTYPLKIKKEVDFYIFLSAYALNQLPKRLEELPVPIFMPKELPVYLNNPNLVVNIYIFSNRETIEKLGIGKIKSYFNFSTKDLNEADIDIDVTAL